MLCSSLCGSPMYALDRLLSAYVHLYNWFSNVVLATRLLTQPESITNTANRQLGKWPILAIITYILEYS